MVRTCTQWNQVPYWLWDNINNSTANGTSRKELRTPHLKESISETGLATGIRMDRELVKNSSLRQASRFLGTFTADSLMVRSECNRLIKSFCIPLHQDRLNNSYRDAGQQENMNSNKNKTQYQSRVIWPLEIIEEAAFGSCSIYLTPILNVITKIHIIELEMKWYNGTHLWL